MSDSIGDRMKGYEDVARSRLVRRTPVIIRVDGRAFHTLTRGFAKPHDAAFIDSMEAAAVALCQEVAGARLAYVQSDEISVLLVDYQSLTTEAWFDNQVQKIASVSASIATVGFNRRMATYSMSETYRGRDRATFDARAFNMPREEVANYFLWRQQDATRNSIQGLGQRHYSAKQLHGVNCDQIQEMLHRDHGINWNNIETHLKRGACVVKTGEAEETRWAVDLEIPVFSRDRDYIERHVLLKETP